VSEIEVISERTMLAESEVKELSTVRQAEEGVTQSEAELPDKEDNPSKIVSPREAMDTVTEVY